jgi:methylglutaconyl-CoA hydratase
MNYETLVYTKKDDIVTVTLNRPDVHNAMNEMLMNELTACFQQVSNDDSVTAVILTGNGKSFCAGADLTWMKQMVNFSREENKNDSRLLLDMYETIYSCPKLAVCDITITVPELKFAFSEVKLGIIPAVISTFVAARMKPADMRRFFITGERFDSVIANEIGLIDLVIPSERLDETVQTFVEHIRSSGPRAIKEIKELIDNFIKMDVEKYKELTVEKISELRVSQEGQEGVTAFLEKRKPNWKR